MRPRLTIRAKMIALIALPTLAIYVGVLGVMMVHLRNVNRAEVERNMTRMASNYAARFDGAFREVAAIGLATARFAETAPDLTEQQIFAQLRANVSQNPLVYGAAMAFEPGTFKRDDSLFCPYVSRGPEGLREMDITRDTLDWYGDERWQWWHRSKESGGALWTDPYFDEGAGGVLMVTFSAPFERDGAFRGVTTIDVMIPALRESVGRSILRGLRFVILTDEGRFVSSKFESEIAGRTVFERAIEAGRPDIAEVCRAITSGETGVAALPGWDGEPPELWEDWTEAQWIFYAPIESTGWSLAALLPERVALADVRARLRQASVVLSATLLLIIACIWFVSGRFTRPIVDLTGAVRRIAGGDLDHRVEVTSRDELGELAGSVNTMAGDLKGYTETLARTRSQSREAMIFAMAKLAESRDDDTGKHLERICRYVELLGTELANGESEIDEEWARTVTVTAALHDIGKVGIPDSVLKKPGRLTDEERRVMNAHTTIGGDALLAVKRQWTEDAFLKTAAEIALLHHERWDGKGYPYGLSGDDISLAARVVAVADVYDALTSERVYKKAMPHDEAKAIIVEGAGKHFDPIVVEAFLAAEDGFRGIAEELR